ncbi:mannose-1-phosphate guanylyltransferase [Demequina mangrovi]|uniref:Mannose-1-phosphate guanylyltransferase (GDP) /mannose-6-phosphate isomerase, type 2 n=1 Tax=Demequina mangrovi TaxID=1043493 RepID=A0A1H6XX76_9MICO|nr:mannose-1-phosphate guanylyltransferase [Demequina mangrovi]SEJ33668.1 mannose-1-phosphate guanylyltransferase (GDP) /mannose-6-phosphate isomerase, type 2 [Demequina mangrovi]
MSEVVDGLVTVIPAGGVGSRLWPLSQPHRPKFLLDLLGTGATLIQDTVARVSPLSERVVIVTGERHAPAVASQVPEVPAANLVTEPSPRDSMAAIALAAALIEERWGSQVMASFAADHLIPDAEAFRATVREAARAAQGGKVVVIGIEPTEPSTAFGYIEMGEPIDGDARHVVAFTEKPDAETAAGMLARGGFAWNAGMFVMRTDVLLGHLDRLQPTLAAGAREIAAAWDGPSREEVLARVWPTLTKIAIDHAIAEPVAAEGGVAVVPASFEWHDVGDFDSLAELSEPTGGAVSIGREAAVATVGASAPLVVGGTKPVVVVGVDDAVVVESDEAILVTVRSAAQRVKDAAGALAEA